jgi:hypothetical protein
LGKSVEEKSSFETNSKASFWKNKYFVVVLALQNSLIDLELENQFFRTKNKALIEYNKTHVLKLKPNKKEDLVTINSPGVNILVNSKFKTFTS